MAATSESETVTTMRAPKDVVRMVSVIATMDGKSIHEFADTDLREWVTKKYKARIAAEGRANDRGGEE